MKLSQAYENCSPSIVTATTKKIGRSEKKKRGGNVQLTRSSGVSDRHLELIMSSAVSNSLTGSLMSVFAAAIAVVSERSEVKVRGNTMLFFFDVCCDVDLTLW